MSGLRGHIWNLFLIWLMVLCFGISLVSAEKLKDRENIYMLYQEEMPLSEAQALEMQATEAAAGDPINFTVWGVRSGLTVENEFLERQVTAAGIPIAGRSDLILSSDVRLDAADYEGCLLSGDLAYELYGTRAAAGRLLLLEGNEYTVRGILDEAKNTIVYQCRAEDGAAASMDAVAIEVPQGMYKKDILHAFSQRYEGFGNEEAALSIFSAVAGLAVMIVPLLIGILIFVPMIRTTYRQRKSPVLFITAAGATVLLALLYLWLAQPQLEVPLDLIPGSWSDFDAWSMTMETERERIWTVLLAEKREPERILVEYFIQTVKYTLFALFFFVFFIRKIRFQSLTHLYVYGAVSMLSAFFAIWYQRVDGQSLVRNRSFWFLLMFYFAAVYMYERKAYMKRWIKTNR